MNILCPWIVPKFVLGYFKYFSWTKFVQLNLLHLSCDIWTYAFSDLINGHHSLGELGTCLQILGNNKGKKEGKDLFSLQLKWKKS